MRIANAWLAAVIAAATVVVASACSGSTTGSSDGPDFQTIDFTTKAPDNTPTRPIVMVNIGTSKPLPLLLDTGSVGLHVFSSALEGAEEITQETNATQPNTYGDGTTFTGNFSSAVISVGGNATKGPIAFETVTKVSCPQSQPDCPGKNGPSGILASWGTVGILGVGIGKDVLPSFMLNLAAGLPSAITYSFDQANMKGTVTFNQPPASPAAAFTLQPGQATANGSPTWLDDQTNVCWTLNQGQPSCVGTLFDTGTGDLGVPQVVVADAARPDQILVSGSEITLSASSNGPTLSFTSGQAPAINRAFSAPPDGDIIGLAGEVFFNQYDVTFDLAGSQVLAAANPNAK